MKYLLAGIYDPFINFIKNLNSPCPFVASGVKTLLEDIVFLK